MRTFHMAQAVVAVAAAILLMALPLSAQQPRAGLAAADAATTDPRALLRQIPRVQLDADGASPASPARAPAPYGATRSEESGMADENVSGEASAPSAADVQSPVQTAPPAEESRPKRSFLRKIPLVGRILPGDRSSRDDAAPAEPTATPPVLLPPPGAEVVPPADGAGRTPVAPQIYPGTAAGTPSDGTAPPPALRAPQNFSGGLLITPPTAKAVFSPSPAPARSVAPPPSTTVAPGTPALPSVSPTVTQSASAAAVATSTPPPPGGDSVPRVIYPRFTNADFVAPPSELEPNDAARNEYLQALTLARLGRAAEAAAALRAFAQHYPASRLASRALFLAALVDTQPDAVAQDVALLRQFFPRSEYLTELQLRGVIGPGGISAASPTPTPTPASNARLDALRALAKLREEAEQDYRDRNYAAAVAKLENSPLTQQSPELLDLMAQSLVALGDNVRAATIIEKVLAEFPNYEGRKNLLLTYGLVLEDAGKYERAIAEYRKLIEEAPDSVEAQTARVRIQQLDQLSR